MGVYRTRAAPRSDFSDAPPARGATVARVRLPKPIFNNPDFTPEHPTPVLFVHGFQGRTSAFKRQARYLAAHGYWVWGFDYGRMRVPGLYGTGDLDELVTELASNVDKVLTATGAAKVDIVAHSQGGTVTKLFIAAGGHEKVRRVVTMGSPFHGTDLDGRAKLISPVMNKQQAVVNRLLGESATQHLVGSEWLLARVVPDTHPDVVYTSLYSRRDHIVTPNSTSMLESVDGADVVNMEIPGAPLHPLMPRDLEIARLTRWGLERKPGETTPPF